MNMSRESIGSLFTLVGMLLIIWSLNKIGRKKFWRK